MRDLKLQFRVFGSLNIYCGERPVFDSGSIPGKPLELLALLLLSEEKRLSREQIMDFLWGDENSVGNPSGTLKSTVYRLRKELCVIDSQEEFIIKTGNMYAWNPELIISVDAVELEKIHRAPADNTLSLSERIALGRKVMGIYKGDIQYGSSMCPRILELSNYYHMMYLSVINELCTGLLDMNSAKAYEELISVANRALSFEPLSDSLYTYIFVAMRKLKMRQAILKLYPCVRDMFLSDLGETPNSEIEMIFTWASATASNIDSASADLLATLGEDSENHGAYFCEPESFRHICRFMTRTVKRENCATKLILLTINLREGLPELSRAIPALKSAIGESLRSSDAYCRTGRNQFMAILTFKIDDDYEKITERIQNHFTEKCDLRNLTVNSERLITGSVLFSIK